MDKRYFAKVIIAFCTIDMAAAPAIAFQFLELEYFFVVLFGAFFAHAFIMYLVYQIINDLK